MLVNEIITPQRRVNATQEGFTQVETSHQQNVEKNISSVEYWFVVGVCKSRFGR